MAIFALIVHKIQTRQTYKTYTSDQSKTPFNLVYIKIIAYLSSYIYKFYSNVIECMF